MCCHGASKTSWTCGGTKVRRSRGRTPSLTTRTFSPTKGRRVDCRSRSYMSFDLRSSESAPAVDCEGGRPRSAMARPKRDRTARCASDGLEDVVGEQREKLSGCPALAAPSALTAAQASSTCLSRPRARRQHFAMPAETPTLSLVGGPRTAAGPTGRGKSGAEGLVATTSRTPPASTHAKKHHRQLAKWGLEFITRPAPRERRSTRPPSSCRRPSRSSSSCRPRPTPPAPAAAASSPAPPPSATLRRGARSPSSRARPASRGCLP